MKTIIKEYQGKNGTVTIVRYENYGEIVYHVTHSNHEIGGYWANNKVDAIKHAQFLAGKY